MPARTALLLLATGARYRSYVDQMVASAKKYFVEHDAILWTDGLIAADVKFMLTKQAEGFPNETLHRYHTFLAQRWLLETYDYVFYVDIDATFVSTVTEEDIFSDGITATIAPGYYGMSGTPETNPQSTAYLLRPRTYFAGGFVGGRSGAFLKMAETIARNIDIDAAHGILARWHDESHLNRYLYDNPPAKILTPAYCYPDKNHNQEYYRAIWRRAGVNDFKPKIELINKGNAR